MKQGINEIARKRTLVRGIALLASLATALMMVWALVPGMAVAGPVQGEGTWSDDFSGSTLGVDEFDRTKVAGDSLRLAEGQPTDLGEAVPGESAVYALLGTTLGDSAENLYCGTGEKGHLVEYDPTELYQEAYQGPCHWGVASSRGQAIEDEKDQGKVLSLTEAGSHVYGGTQHDSGNGRLFSFDTTAPGSPCDDKGVPGGGGSINALVYDSGSLLLFGGTSAGHVFSYNGGFTDIGQPSGTSAVNALAVRADVLYVGSQDGRLYSYNIAAPAGFNNLGSVGSPIQSLAYSATDDAVYIGVADGHLHRFNIVGSTFEDLGEVSASAVNALEVDDASTTVYVGSQDGHIYSYLIGDPAGSFVDMGVPANSDGQPVNALAMGADGVLYGGTGADVSGSSGRLFRLAGYEDHDPTAAAPASPMNSIAYFEKKVYFGNAAGDLYTYTEPDTFDLVTGSPIGSAINDMATTSGVGHIVTESGYYYAYYDGAFSAAEAPDPADLQPINAIETHWPYLYVGLDDGRLYSHPTAGTGFTPFDTPQLPAAVHDIVYDDDQSTLYIACADGNLYSGTDSVTNHGSPTASIPNALAAYGGDVYVGYQNGELYSFDGVTETFSAVLGDCGSQSVISMADGCQGVFCGTDDGHVWTYEESCVGSPLKDLGQVPGSAPWNVRSLCHINGSVFGGTDSGRLFSHDDAYLGDRDQVVKKQIMIWCSAYDAGEGLFYAGTYRNAHFLVIDPTTGGILDRGRPIDGEREIEDILVADSGTVYGCTYAGTGDLYNPDGGRLFTFDPATMAFDDKGQPGVDDTWWISSLADGPEAGDDIYGATSNSTGDITEGSLFRYDGGFTDLGVPVSGEGTRTIARSEDRIYGGTWDPLDNSVSHVYYYDTGGGTFTTVGEAPPDPDGVTTDRHINRLGVLPDPDSGDDIIYGAQNNGYMFSFDPSGSYDDTKAVLGKPASSSESVYPLQVSCDNTIMCGTTASTGGHLASYDPWLGEFRDICDPVPAQGYQDRIATISYQGSILAEGVTLLGTRGSLIPAEQDWCAARLFLIEPYRDGTECNAVSCDITPRVRQLDVPAPADTNESISSLCPAPGDAKLLYGGTCNGSGADGRLLLHNSIDDQVSDLGVALGGHNGIGALCAGGDGYVYGGTINDDGNARLFRFYPVLEAGDLEVENLGVPLAGARGIFSLAWANGKVYVGTGDKAGSTARLVEYDPVRDDFTDRGVCGYGKTRLSALTPGSDGKLYGGTSPQPTGSGAAQFVSYDPSTPGTPPSTSTPTAMAGEQGIYAAASGPGKKVYLGTGPSGRLVSYDTESQVFTHESAGWPYSDDAVLSLASTENAVFGCAGVESRLFRFVPSSGYTDIGPLAYDTSGATAGTTDNLGKPYFGTTRDTLKAGSEARLLRYDGGYRFSWGRVNYNSTVPAGNEVHVDVLNEAGDTTLLSDIASGQDISGLSGAGIRLRGRLKSDSSDETPEIDDWEVTWEGLPGIDQVYPGQAYHGDDIFIWGTNLGSGGTVTVGGTAATTQAWTSTFIWASVPMGATNGQVTVTVGTEQSNTESFSLLLPPQLDSLSPASAHAGDIVELQGSWFLSGRGSSYVSFNGAPGLDYPAWSNSRVRVRVPENASTGNLRVYVNGHASNPKSFQLLPGGGPQVGISSPLDGSEVTGDVEIRASVDCSEQVEKVDFLVDGELLATDKTAPYSCNWNVDDGPDGGRLVKARAVDAIGRKGQDSVTVYADHTVPTASGEWYFAEGCTDYGFETWLLIQNPSDEQALANVSYMDEDGDTAVATYLLEANSRTTVNVGGEVEPCSLSIAVSADHEVICERAMYWDDRVEGHGTVGTTSLCTDWYFAEGCTDYGFETYVLLGNPSDSPVDATLVYTFPGGDTLQSDHALGAYTRLTIDASKEVGAREFGVQVTADEPGIVAERAMYYGGKQCGTGTIGCRAPSTTWYLSEGSTAWGFETWLLIQRPDDGDASVEVTYRKSDGETLLETYPVKGHERCTIDLSEAVGSADVSTHVTSDLPVVCERAMYWSERSAGHVTIGSPGPDREWYLAEGCTGYGFETWLLLDNSTAVERKAIITFMKEDGTVLPAEVSLRPTSRTSVDAASFVGETSFSVEITCDVPIMVERAVYWNDRQGGTGSIGAR